MCKYSHVNIIVGGIRQDSMYKLKYLTQCVQKWEGSLDPCAHDSPRPLEVYRRTKQVRVDDVDLVGLVWYLD